MNNTRISIDQVAAMMADVLRASGVAHDADFFELGGDSLRAVLLANRIADWLGAEHDSRVSGGLRSGIFSHPTPNRIVQLVENLSLRPSTGPSVETNPSPPLSPLSPQQEQLWLHRRTHPDSAAYNVVNVFDVIGPLDADRLSSAVQRVAERHPALVTALDAGEHCRPCLTVHDPVEIRIQAEPRCADRAEAMGALNRPARMPFAFGQLPIRVHRVPYGRDGASLLMFVLDHACCDGWSMPIFYRELGEAYGGGIGQLPPVGSEHGPKRSRLDPAAWAERLLPLPRPLILDDSTRGRSRDFKGRTRYTTLSHDSVNALDGWLADQEATRFTGLMTCFQLALRDVTGRSSFLNGTPFANRLDLGSEGVIGYYANTMVFKAQIGETPSYEALVAKGRSDLVEAVEHQGLAFIDLVSMTNPERSADRTPLIDVMFVMQNTDPVRLCLDGCSAAPLRYDNDTAKFDLTLEAFNGQAGVELRWEWASRTVSARVVDHVVQRFEAHVEAMANRVEVCRNGGPRRELPRAPSEDRTIGSEFARVAAEARDRTALIADGRAITFDQLHRRAAAVGEHLMYQAAGPGSRIGVLSERSPELVAAALGIWRIGGTYVPLDPSLGDEYLLKQIEIAQVERVLASPGNEDRALHFGRPISTRGALRESPRSLGPPPLVVHPDDAAYIVFTSGSAGDPRGVIGHHAGLLNRVGWMNREWPMHDSERGCLRTGIGFIDSLTELLGSLLAGRPSVVVPDRIGRDAAKMLHLLREQDVSRMVITPTHLQVLVSDFPDRFAELTPLRVCVVSGERLPADLCNRFYDLLPESVLLNLYGSSEVAGDVTWFNTSSCGTAVDPVPIGEPLTGCTVRIEDDRGRPVPDGEEGELVVGGAQVALGYTDTAPPQESRFITTESGDRLFRTRDLVRRLPDGMIVYSGRRDRAVKVRGTSVHLDGVESVLEELPGVARAAAIAIDLPAGTRVEAWVESHETSETLRRELTSRVPGPMVPASIHPVTVLPRTRSGKLDYSALRGTSSAGSPPVESPQDHPPVRTPPSGPVEEGAHRVFCDVLGLENVGRTDDFFSMGGDSLAANRVLSRMCKEHGLADLDFNTFYENPTVAGLALLTATELVRTADPRVLSSVLEACEQWEVAAT